MFKQGIGKCIVLFIVNNTNQGTFIQLQWNYLKIVPNYYYAINFFVPNHRVLKCSPTL